MSVILIVDDELAIRKFLEMMLPAGGHEGLTAGNGSEAVAQLRSRPHDIDLVISDLRMPVMSGTEAIRRIRETRPDICIICMTGFSEDEPPPRVTVVPKPFRMPDMLGFAEQLLAQRQPVVLPVQA